MNDYPLYNKKEPSIYTILSKRANPSLWMRYIIFYFDKVVRNGDYLGKEMTNDAELLFPDFLTRVMSLKERYEEVHPNHVVAFFETFRNNYMQKVHYNNGVSQIKAYGMHHFSIAVDLINYRNNRIKWDLDYDLITRLCKQVDLFSLSPYEQCHVQFVNKESQNSFRNFIFSVVRSIQDLFNVQRDGFIGPITQGQIIMQYDRLKKYFENETKNLKKYAVTD